MIRVLKRDASGRVAWEYTGVLLARAENSIRLEARFNRPDLPFQGILLKQGDRFVETFYTDRWYNTFEIHDRDDDALKGWYCNVGRPAVWEAPDTLSYVDLILDLWVTPAGAQTVLDELEFEQSDLDAPTRALALHALAQLQQYFLTGSSGLPGK